jgi:hypothetical protein
MNVPPRLSNTQMIRAALLASASAALRNGMRRGRSAPIYGCPPSGETLLVAGAMQSGHAPDAHPRIGLDLGDPH